MATVRVYVRVEKDGLPVDGFPIDRTLTLEQVVGFNPYILDAQAPDTYVAVPVPTVDVMELLVLSPDKAITVRLGGQTDAGAVISAGGLLLLLGSSLTAGAPTNATVYAAAETTISGLAGGQAT